MAPSAATDAARRRMRSVQALFLHTWLTTPEACGRRAKRISGCTRTHGLRRFSEQRERERCSGVEQHRERNKKVARSRKKTIAVGSIANRSTSVVRDRASGIASSSSRGGFATKRSMQRGRMQTRSSRSTRWHGSPRAQEGARDDGCDDIRYRTCFFVLLPGRSAFGFFTHS